MPSTTEDHPLHGMSLTELQSLAKDLPDVLDLSPKEWFEKARHAADKAVLAERWKRKEEMFVEYIRACQCYQNTRVHPKYAEEKKKDLHWTNRVKEFQEMYESFLQRAKEVKDALKDKESHQPNGASHVGSSHTDRPNMPDTQSNNGPDTKTIGSIADRMRALQGAGMESGPSNLRGSTQRGIPDSKSSTGGSTVTAGVGAHGLARRAGQVDGPQAKSTSSTGQSENHRPKPIVPPKPQALKQHGSPAADQQNHPQNSATSSSATQGQTRQYRSATSPTQPESPSFQRPTLQSHHSGPTHSHRSVSPSRSQGPTTPSSPHRSMKSPLASPTKVVSTPPPHASRSHSTDEVNDFEKAFPSLSDFGKQFELSDEPPPIMGTIFEDSEAPHGRSNRSGSIPGPKPGGPREPRKGSFRKDTDEEISFPSVPNFPDIPSAPTHKPNDLPPPPSDANDLKKPHGDPPKAFHPPSPDLGSELKRSASTPNVATLMDDDEKMFPVAPTEVSKPVPPPMPEALRKHRANGSGSSAQPTSIPGGNPKPESSRPLPTHFEKPRFPLTNSIEPDTIRTYLLNPAVDVLFLDVRPEEEYKISHVGEEYEERGAKVTVVWMDPTVLCRDGMTSAKLEDALSLSPEVQRKAFEKRNKYDVVVVYDSKSKSWPRKETGSTIPPLARLWEIIYEQEFSKKLERTPVLLSGGYATWVEFIKGRAAKHAADYARMTAMAQANGHGVKSPKLPNGYTHERSSSRPLSGDMTAKRVNRDMPVYQSSQYAKNITDSFGYAPQSMTGDSAYQRTASGRPYVTSPTALPLASHSPSKSTSSYSANQPSAIAPPPQASIRPGPGSRRRSDFVEHENQSYPGYASPPSRSSVDYPQAHALAKVPQPPPPAQSHSFDRYDTRPAVVRSGSIRGLDLVSREGDEVRYWNSVALGLTGLKNLGNTCYMNSTIQCLSATFPFTSYFLDGSYKRSINVNNPLGMKGALANAFAELLKAMWKEDYTFLSPVTFRKGIINFAHQFSGTDQHDSQEFLSFVLDGLHEDLNRIKQKPPPIEMTPEREAALETLPPEVASEKEWQIYRRRDDSFIVDLFQGQYRNRLECLTCHKTSTTYDTFMYLSLPVPTNKKHVILQELIDEFVSSEMLEKDDAWNCPRCKVPRTASKTLTLSRLPPILLIQLKRFYTKDGMFWNKSETPVIYPVNSMDLTRYLPSHQMTGKEDLDDPRTQNAPFKYDLYGVTNHMGSLSSGHYTCYVKSSKGWMFCEDSRITPARENDVVSRPAYILFYKRVRV
ncbi:hypothetical protein BD324DRAFT_613498 [Kockovaella imperatae]|uniref:ubiquitinyl hydrolase 1 n=1 Tax=Kockovaella imperatae TaxID=4999 RepID=A0A1Y1UT33_9TREE|nr:hypothetical protein BD324DRAFT_613498 [Kockovaella imperatae]ORX41170.1 hypothetical protein BD324DRAFT_613498 [Kockovaella imperatae]